MRDTEIQARKYIKERLKQKRTVVGQLMQLQLMTDHLLPEPIRQGVFHNFT